ncbi:MAG: ThuA domain-containing protein [Planctomycetia bacterium]|nr:ThuA domain-containing protein [Planctomycetia bacterium]
MRCRWIAAPLALLLCALANLGVADEPKPAEAPKLAAESPKLKVLIVDGQNNHDWRKTTPVMKHALESCGRFQVDVSTAPSGGDLSSFQPKFSNYDAVLSNYNGGSWSPQTRQSLVDYVHGGGGFVVVHAADNSFPDWPEYNEMTGLGGWGGRNEKSGPYVYYKDGKQVEDKSRGGGGSHGPQHPFQIVVRDPAHPITKDMPITWMHGQDELYTHLRGPAHNMKVLATAYAPKKLNGRDVDEPMLMVLDYGKGRVFHTPMGHADYSMKCAGFTTALQRGTEWAATGKVTIPIPADFPTADKVSNRKP